MLIVDLIEEKCFFLILSMMSFCCSRRKSSGVYLVFLFINSHSLLRLYLVSPYFILLFFCSSHGKLLASNIYSIHPRAFYFIYFLFIFDAR